MNKQTNEIKDSNTIDIYDYLNRVWKNKFFILSFTLILTSISIIYVLTIPNIYQARSVLLSSESSPSFSKGASAMAALAGISLGGSGKLSVGQLFQLLLSDYEFNKKIITKHRLGQLLDPYNIDKHLIFPKNNRTVYNFLNKPPKKPTVHYPYNKKEIYNMYKTIRHTIGITENKEDGTLIISATFPDRFVAQKLVTIYLKEMSEHIKALNMKNIEQQERYYQKELANVKNLDLKSNYATLLSDLVKKKVQLKSEDFYMVKQLIKARVPLIQDKIGPKRANIVLLTLISSIILGIILVFLKYYLSLQKKEDSIDNINSLSY